MADVASALKDWSEIAANNGPGGTATVGAGLDDNLREMQKVIKVALGHIVSVKDYGAVGDGTTDDTTAIQAAIDASAGKVLYCPNPAVGYLVSNLTLERPIVILGDSVSENVASGKTQVGTRFLAKSGSTGSMFTIDRGATYWNDENAMYGVAMKYLFLDGNARTVDMSAIDMSRVDRLVLEDVNIQHFKYQALRFNTSVRESWVSRVRTRFCGSVADDMPCVDLRENSTGDGHNNIVIADCQFIFSLGHTCEIEKFSGATTAPRNITFDNCMVHGIVPSIDGLPYTFTSGQKQLKHLIIGDVDQTGLSRINSINTRWFTAGDAVQSIQMTSDADNALLTMVGGEVSNHYGTTGDYDGVTVAAGTFVASAVYMNGNDAPITQTGGNVYLDSSCVFSGNATNPILVANSTTKRWDFHTLTLANGIFENLNRLDVATIRSQTTAAGLTIQARLDSSAVAFVIQTMNGSGALGNRFFVESGATPKIRCAIPLNLPSFSNATRPAANTYTAGTMIWNTDDNFINVTDGTNWKDPTGAST